MTAVDAARVVALMKTKDLAEILAASPEEILAAAHALKRENDYHLEELGMTVDDLDRGPSPQ